VRVPVDHRKELRAAFTVLALFWLATALCYFVGWVTPAFIAAALGALAASERFFRIVNYSPSRFIRYATSCVWLVVAVATFALGVFCLAPNSLPHAGA